MSLPNISIRNPVFAWMLMASLIIFGYLSFLKMGVSQLPDVDFPVVNITVNYEGAAPEIIEADVIDPIESAMMALEGIKNITSTARLGTANISIEFNLEKNIDIAVQEVEGKMNQANRNLPRDITPPVITKVNPDDRPIMWLSVSSTKMQTKDLMSYVRDHVKDKFQTVAGVADINLGGYVDPNLRIWANPEKLQLHQMTVSDIINAIQTEHKEYPAGYIESGNSELNVRSIGEANTVEDVAQIPILRRGGAPNYIPIVINDVATVEDGLADVRRISRVMGNTAIGLGIRKQRGSNSVEVAEGIRAKIVEVKKTLPPDLDISINFDTTKFIEESIHELNFNMILSSILTAIVCWFFLGSFRATFNVILAIPTSILGTFIFLKYFNFTLNTFTLLGLSLAIGIVVDDAIMVLENIYRHRDLGKDKIKASQDGANEISFAALAATVAIMAIFIPVTQMEGVIGKFFFQFGVTISIAVGISYIEALTLTPMRTSQFMEKSHQTSKITMKIDTFLDWLMQSYKRTLNTALKYRALVLVGSIAFFAITFFLVKTLPKEFVPAQDTSSFMVRVKTKDGSSIAFTSNSTRKVEEYFQKRPEVLRFFVAIGGFGGGDTNTANMFVTLKKPSERKLTQLELLDVYRKDLKSFEFGKVFIQDTSQSGLTGNGRGFPVEFTIVGSDWHKLADASKNIIQEMQNSGLYTDIDSDYKENIIELHLIPDRMKAKLRGVSIQEIGYTVGSLVGGVVIGKFSKEGHRNDIRIKVKSTDTQRENFNQIYVRNIKGELVSLMEVAEIKEVKGVQSIARKDRQRAITIFAGMAPKKSQGEALDLAKKISHEKLPQGYQMMESGTSDTFRSSFKSLIFALILGIIVSYMILGSQFNSFIDPFIVLMALPFSISGGFVALWISQQSINIYSMIGFILLMGIVKKNSILLVDFTNKRILEGLNVHDALLDACPTRLRPILMTTVSTIAGAMPLAFAWGAGSENLIPMAQAVIGGSIASTVLTLYVIPCLYSYIGGRKKLSA